MPMELKLTNKGKDTLDLELKGEDIAISHIVLDELHKDKNVTFAGVHEPHPLFRSQILRVQTSRGEPIQAVLSSITRSKQSLEKLQEAAKKTLTTGRM